MGPIASGEAVQVEESTGSLIWTTKTSHQRWTTFLPETEDEHKIIQTEIEQENEVFQWYDSEQILYITIMQLKRLL